MRCSSRPVVTIMFGRGGGVGTAYALAHDAHIVPPQAPQGSVEMRLSLGQQDRLMMQARCLLPHLQVTAAVRSAAGVSDLVESGALQRIVTLLRLVNACSPLRHPDSREMKALCVEGVCSASTTLCGARALVETGGVAPMVRAISAADRTCEEERDLLEFGALAIGNLASHQDEHVVDHLIAADAHLVAISIVADGRVTEETALAGTRALHNLSAGHIRGQVRLFSGDHNTNHPRVLEKQSV